MSHSVDLYWSFRSPYSYLVTGRMADLARTYDVDVSVRLVAPLAVRDRDFFNRVNPLWPPYLLRDTMRLGEYLGIPFSWPMPDPVVQEIDDSGKFRTADEQPYIFRLLRAGQAACERGKGLAFIDEVSKLIFGGTAMWHEGDHLSGAAARAGLDLAELDAAAAENGERYDAEIEANQAALESAGHWGVPTMVFDGEVFFGQDRFDLLKWRLEQNGLAAR